MDEQSLETRPAQEGGTLFRLRARPGASRNGLEGIHGGALKVAVHAPPEKGKANKALLEVLAKTLGIPKNRFSLAKGETSKDKWIAVQGVSPAELERRIQKALKK